MQDNTITLPVDELNNATLVNHVYTRYDAISNRSWYNGPGHTELLRNQMSLFRSAAKPNGNFKGVRKTALKFTKDHTVLGVDGVSNLVAPAIADCGFSLPVGMTSAQKLLFRQTVIAGLDHALMNALQDNLDI